TVRLKPDTTANTLPVVARLRRASVGAMYATVGLKPDATVNTSLVMAGLRATCVGATYVVSGFSRTRCGSIAMAVLFASAVMTAQSPKYRVGRAPTEDESRALGIMVAPDGTGL